MPQSDSDKSKKAGEFRDAPNLLLSLHCLTYGTVTYYWLDDSNDDEQQVSQYPPGFDPSMFERVPLDQIPPEMLEQLMMGMAPPYEGPLLDKDVTLKAFQEVLHTALLLVVVLVWLCHCIVIFVSSFCPTDWFGSGPALAQVTALSMTAFRESMGTSEIGSKPVEEFQGQMMGECTTGALRAHRSRLLTSLHFVRCSSHGTSRTRSVPEVWHRVRSTVPSVSCFGFSAPGMSLFASGLIVFVCVVVVVFL